MPDLTSTLLAMYQQIIGGSAAREQASLEAECARRVILAGVTIGPGGTTTFPGAVMIGTLNLTGAVSLASLTVGTLTVTGTTTLGNTTLVGTLAVTGAVQCTGPLTVTGGTTTLGPTTLGNTSLGGTLAVTGDTTITGNLLVSAVGPHQFLSGVAATPLVMRIRHTAAGAAVYTQLSLGNDVNPDIGNLFALSSTFASNADSFANGMTLRCNGAGSLVLAAQAPIRFFLTGTERLQLAANGALLLNSATNVGTQLMIGFNGATTAGIAPQNTNAANTGSFFSMVNSAGGLAGSIAHATATTVTYNTSSDARLKDDAGRATDLAALRAVVVHDFRWKADGVRARGIFAQEAHPLFPAAVTPGTDETTDEGSLTHPWMTDYSKFVPDLIVGWQQHEADLAVLRAALAAQVGS